MIYRRELTNAIRQQSLERACTSAVPDLRALLSRHAAERLRERGYTHLRSKPCVVPERHLTRGSPSLPRCYSATIHGHSQRRPSADARIRDPGALVRYNALSTRGMAQLPQCKNTRQSAMALALMLMASSCVVSIVQENERVRTYRKNRCDVFMCSFSFELLNTFLQDNEVMTAAAGAINLHGDHDIDPCRCDLDSSTCS